MKAYENNLDIFESVFKRSIKQHFEREDFQLNKILIVGDNSHLDKLSAFMGEYSGNCISFEYDAAFTWLSLKTKLEEEQPDLILIQRQLGISNKDLSYSVGPVLESVTQESNVPVLVLPLEFEGLKIETIGIGFDHQIDNSYLVNKGLLMRKNLKNLELIHIEDETTFNYYLDAISKIPGINTEFAETTIKDTIMDLSGDFFKDVAGKLKDDNVQTTIHCQFGETVKCYEEILDNRKIDLLVFEAEDESKMAMHSLGHSLTIQFSNTATLLV